DEAAAVGDTAGREEILGGRERLDREAKLPEQIGQRLAHRLVVIDHRDERALFHHGFLIASRPLFSWGVQTPPPMRSSVAASADGGIENKKVVPGPSFASAHSLPPWLSMMERLTDRPMPMPSLLVV